MMEWHFMRPEWLWSLLPAVVIALLLLLARTQNGSWQSVIDPELLKHLTGNSTQRRQTNWLPLILLGWILAAIAASGPSWEKVPQPIHRKQDAVVLVLDLSYSMKAADLAPSRIDRARQKILDVLAQRQEGQTGLIAFAGDAHIVTPLTDDTQTIANLLPALHPDMMPLLGSKAGDAVELALQLFKSAGVDSGRILLVTDGVDSSAKKKILKTLRGSNIELAILGIGTARGAPIPMPRGGFVKDSKGAIVMPKLDQESLSDLAGDSRGKYRTLDIVDSDIDYLLSESALTDREQTQALDRSADHWDDKGYWLVLLLLPISLGLFRRGVLLGLVPLLFVLPAEQSYAQTGEQPSANAWDNLWLTPDQQGRRALEQGNSEAAANLFENQDWAGTAAYQQGDFDTAIEHFSSADSADAWYNRGNALARGGKLDEAISAYEESLQRAPDREDAEQNRKLLEELKKQQEQQQNQQNGDEGEQQEGDQGENSDSQNQNGSQQEQSSDQQSSGEQGDQAEQQSNNGQQDSGDEGSDSSFSPTENPPEQSEGEQSGGTPEEQEQPDSSNEDMKDTDQGESKDPAGKEQSNAMAGSANDAQSEEDQATEQWLRRVPDDPSGLLRQKFRYESEQRRRAGEQINTEDSDETFW
jgi:Ca-activated chloride channel family protein